MNKQDWKDHEKLVEALKWSLYYARKYIDKNKKNENRIYIKCLETANKTLEREEKKIEMRCTAITTMSRMRCTSQE